jgi:3-mercaptopyruvate sulfurtransferase SseA
LLIVGEDDDLAAEHAELAASLGVADVAILQGGIDAWTDAEYPTDTISDGIAPAPPGPKPT